MQTGAWMVNRGLIFFVMETIPFPKKDIWRQKVKNHYYRKMDINICQILSQGRSGCQESMPTSPFFLIPVAWFIILPKPICSQCPKSPSNNFIIILLYIFFSLWLSSMSLMTLLCFSYIYIFFWSPNLARSRPKVLLTNMYCSSPL